MASYSSLKDVAARAGVSFQTASKVLNGHPGAASADTIDRVMAAVSELEYVPSAWRAASSAVRTSGGDHHRGSPTLAWRCSLPVRNAAFTPVAARPSSSPSSRTRNRDKSVRKLLEQRVDGVVVIAPSVERDQKFSALPASLPVVSINHLPGSSATLVGSDHHQTGVLAVNHLVDLGHEKIATVTGPSTRGSLAAATLDSGRVEGSRDPAAGPSGGTGRLDGAEAHRVTEVADHTPRSPRSSCTAT
jgi:LacI family transcriptional regulator